MLANFVYTDSDLCKMYMLRLLFEKQNMFRYINYVDVYPQKEKKMLFWHTQPELGVISL